MIARHRRVVIDLGTGDGHAVLRRAQRDRDSLLVGVDPDAASLRDSSRRAARPTLKGGLNNVLFLVGAADELPGPLAGMADELTVTLPWGSLLRGLLTSDLDLLERLGRTLVVGGRLELMLSVGERERGLGLAPLDEHAIELLVLAYEAAGLTAVDVWPANSRDVERLSSSWAKRLGVPQRRHAWLLRFVRQADSAGLTVGSVGGSWSGGGR